ncbi:MAG: flippase-like domain-containing protein [Chloroflexi bacterium]|nr:flippase-like domain-containing protein [Chloroflexota bacterium]
MGKAGRFLIGIVISVLGLVVVFWGVQPERMLTVLSKATVGYLLPAELVLIAGLAARAISWRILLAEKLPLRKVFDVINIGYLLNAILPFRIGEVGRAYLISRDQAIGAPKIFGTIVVERFLDISVSFSALLVVLPSIVNPEWTSNLLFGVGIGIILLIGGSLTLLRGRQSILRIMQRFSKFGLQRLVGVTEDFISGIEAFGRPKLILRAAFWNFIAWTCFWLQLWFLLNFIGAPGAIPVLLFVSGVIAFGVALPSSPGAIGVFEFAAVAGFLIMGYARETALSVAIVWHVLLLANTALFGGWALAREGSSIFELAGKAQSLLHNRQSQK